MPGEYVAFHSAETLVPSLSFRTAPSLEQAIAAADAMAGHGSTSDGWKALRKTEAPSPELVPPAGATRRQCPKCADYTDSLRLIASRRLPLDLPKGWECDGPERIADLYQCWSCGYRDVAERRLE